MINPWLLRRGSILAAVLAVGLGTAVLVSRSGRVDRPGIPPSRRTLLRETISEPSTAPRLVSSGPRALTKETTPAPVVEKAVAESLESPGSLESLSAEQREPGKAPLDFRLGREEVLKERNGVFGFGNGAYAATIGKGRVEFARALVLKETGQPRLAFDLEEIRMGGTVLARGGEAGARADLEARTVSFDRAGIEERYTLRPDALEQSFVIRSLPAARADLTIRGKVGSNLTPPAEGTVAPSLAFSAQGREVVTLSQAVVVDAAGNRLELPLAYADGRVSMSVPASWMAGATLPIVVDPLMGGPVTLDPSVTGAVGQVNGVPVRLSDVCYNALANEFLVVWQEQFGASAFNGDLYAQRVSAAGAPIGDPIPISVTGDGEYEPTVSWASGVNRYLVAWRHDPADDASDADQFIAGRVLNADGTFFTPSFVLDDLAGQDFGPTLAFDGTNWVCVYTNVVSATDTNVVGRYVGTDGTPGTAVTFDSDADLASAPSVDVSGGTLLVAWQKGVSGGANSIVGRTMSSSGAFLSARTAIDTTANDCRAPDVSAGGGLFLVAWQQTVSATDHNIVGRRVTTSMTFSGNPVNIRATTADQLAPRASFAAALGTWYVVYSDTTNVDSDIYGSRIDTAGKVYGANRITSVAVDEIRPELAWNPATNEMVAVYLYGAASPYEVRAQRVNMDFTAPTVPGTPMATPNPSATETFTLSWAPTVEAGGSGFSNYVLQRSANGGGNWVTVTSPTTETSPDTMPHGEYVYRVRAKDLAGNYSAYSPISAAVVVDNANPAEPIGLQQFRADGVTSLAPGQSTAESSVVLGATIHDLGLLDGFEDSNVTLNPMWTVAAGTWAVGTDGYKILHDGSGLDDQITTPSTQAYGSWEYRFKIPSIGTAAATNLQGSFYLFLDTPGLGGNGYRVLVSAGKASTKTVSLYRADGATQSRILGSDANWTPDTAFHVLRVNRAVSGQFDLYLDGVLLGSVVDATYGTAVSTAIQMLTTNGYTLRVDSVRMSSAPAARSAVKLQVEVKPVGSPFDGSGLLESALTASGSAVSVTVPALANGSYHWRARVVDALGNASTLSPFGGNTEAEADFIVNVVPPPPAPGGLTATAGNAQVALQWSPSAGATSYAVKRSLASGGPYAIVAPGLTTPAFTDIGLQNGTPYFYVVSATNLTGEGPNSGEASATPLAPPANPTNLVAIAGNAQVSISWTASPGVTTYSVKRATVSGGPYGIIGTAAQSAYVDVAVTNGLSYFYVVSAVNAGGESGDSTQASATPVAPPAVTTGLAAQAGNARVTLTWNVTAIATSYTLKRSTTAGGPYTPVQSSIAGTSAIDTGLTNGTTYYYVVSAVNAGGEGGNSGQASATPLAAPSAPTGLLATAGNTQVLLTWNPSAGAVSYAVKRGPAAGGPYTLIVSGFTLTTYMDSGLTNGTTYYYVVSAANVGGESPDSTAASATPTSGLNAPTNLVAAPGNARISLTWSPVSGATSYSIRRSVHTGGPYAAVGTSVDASSVDLGLTNGVAYYYVVRALVGASESSDSNEANARPTLGPPAPGNVVAAAGDAQVTLSWTASATATSYKIKRGFSSGGPYTDLGTTASLGYVDTAVSNGAAYYYVVTALNNGGESPPSAEVAAIPVGGPSSLVATSDADGGILLTWTPATNPGLAGYNVYRSGLSGGPYGKINTALITQTSYADAGLAEGTTYYYVVRSQDSSAGENGATNEASATAYTSPIGISGYGVTTGSIDWVRYGNFDPSWTGFVLHDAQEHVIATVGPTVTDFVETGLAENTQYTRHIHPVTPSGLGPASPLSPAYTLVHDPGDADITLSTSRPDAVDFTVVPPPNATKDYTGVQVYYSTDGVRFHRGDYFQGTYTFQEPFLDPNTLYYFKFSYINGDFYESALSPAKSIRTLGSPGYFFGGAQSASSIQWLWESVPGATGYVLHDASENVISQVSGTFTTESGLAENTQYTRHVHAVISGVPGAPSDPDLRYTLIHTATAGEFTAVATGPNSVQISVTPPPGATSGFTKVEISRSLNASSWTAISSTPGTYSFLDTGLAGNTTYYYRIRLFNGDDRAGGFAPYATVLTAPGAAAAPPGFMGVAVSTSLIHWSWGDVPGTSGFVLHDDTHQVIGSVGPGVLGFDESGLAENFRGSRHVHAQSAGFDGLASPTLAVYTLVHDPGPADFTLSVFGRDRLDVFAVPPPSAQSGQTGCEIQIFAGGTWGIARSFSNTYTFSDDGLQAGTSYSYRIRFRNGDGMATNPSASQSASTFNLPPPVITTLSKLTRSTTPIVAGTASPGETITVYYGNTADGTTVATNVNWIYTATPKTQGTYTVVAYGSSSGYSNSITIRVDLSNTAPAPPTNIRAKSYSTATDLEWDASASANVSGYNVYRKIGTDGSWTLLNAAGVVLNTRYRDSGLVTGQHYFYRVTALDNRVND